MRRENDWAKLIGLLVLIGSLVGMVWGVCSYPRSWSEAPRRLDRLEPVVLRQEERISNLEIELKVIDAHYQDIHEDLIYLKRHQSR